MIRKTKKYTESLEIISQERILDCDPIQLAKYLDSKKIVSPDQIYRFLKTRGYYWEPLKHRWAHKKEPAWINRIRKDSLHWEIED